MSENDEFADLWYFVMDECPREFAKVVAECPPSSWMREAAKLKANSPGAAAMKERT